MARRYWIETLGCPKNQVDSDKLAGRLDAEGYTAAGEAAEAEVVVVNTCAFIEAARQESIETVLALAEERREGSQLVVTGCMAERYRGELAAALPEVDVVAPFGVAFTARSDEGSSGSEMSGQVPDSRRGVHVALGRKPARIARTAQSVPSVGDERPAVPSFDLLNLPRPPAVAPWAYVKVAEGCDRRCGFCAIPSFRGPQRSRSTSSILAEIDELDGGTGRLREVVLVAQDLASFGLDRSRAGDSTGDPDRPTTGRRPIAELVAAVAERVDRTRLLYLYPSTLDDSLTDAILATGVPYFDLSLQHVSRPLLKRMRRWGEGTRFLDRIASIRASEPTAVFRSSFIVGYPGETEADHDLLLEWIAAAQLDWVGFFPFSKEEGTFAADLDGQVPAELVVERIRECSELQDAITTVRREALVGTVTEVLVDRPGEGRSPGEAPEIDGIVIVPDDLSVGALVEMVVTGSIGPDLVAEPLRAADRGSDHRATTAAGGRR